MANNDLRGRRIVDSKPVVRAPLDEYGFPHGAGNTFATLFLQFSSGGRYYVSYVHHVFCYITQ